MIIVLRPDATESQVNHIIEKVSSLGLTPHVSKGTQRTIIGVIGPEDILRVTPLEVYPGVRPEYISAVEPDALAPVETVGAGCLMLVAARVGSTRLIDNVVFGEGIP